MAKRNKSKGRGKKSFQKEAKILSENAEHKTESLFGKYDNKFELLRKGEKKHLKDLKSIQNSFIPVEVCDEEVYMSEPDGGLIPEEQNRHKCDYLLYCKNSSQINFIELKGANISAKSGYNPYSQIIDTVKFFKEDEDLKSIVDRKMEKHAFIVSPGRQKIPRGSEIMERQLWKALMQDGTKREINEIVHYVKVTRSDRYSNNKGQIICSPGNPVKIPFQN